MKTYFNSLFIHVQFEYDLSLFPYQYFDYIFHEQIYTIAFQYA